ncbi:MAG: hypothetical protein J7J61_09655 [Candidatus Hydrothermae bacterium]|nr:hypothetical protein [Candidatus Hydrothermae bacterium]
MDIALAVGFIYKKDRRLVIPTCPYCGCTHFHGWRKEDERLGIVTRRCSHCYKPGVERNDYDILIVGFLDDEAYEFLSEKEFAEVMGFEREELVYPSGIRPARWSLPCDRD